MDTRCIVFQNIGIQLMYIQRGKGIIAQKRQGFRPSTFISVPWFHNDDTDTCTAMFGVKIEQIDQSYTLILQVTDAQAQLLYFVNIPVGIVQI